MSDENNKAEALQTIDFSTFLLSLSTNALVHMGEVEDPSAADIPVDMVLAKQTIDIIGMLKEKTKNNLTPEEENLINHILYDLRLRFVQQGKK
jgi:hypothetical protein